MSNHEALRAAVKLHEKLAGGRLLTIEYMDLTELLAEFDALRAAPAKPAKGAYSPEFESAWADYPARPGNSKAAAYKAWQARIKAGASVEEMLAGTAKYAAYCKAMKTEPGFIKQAATFYGPGEHFSADWTVPRGEARRILPDRRTSEGMDAERRKASDEAKRRLRGDRPDDGMTFENGTP